MVVVAVAAKIVMVVLGEAGYSDLLGSGQEEFAIE
jgi:hypothetical protein